MLSLRHRFLLLLALVLLSQTVREWYPFSHYPMYSGFPEQANYVYLRKADGDPVPIGRALGTDGSAVKKMFRSHVRQQDGDSSAAGLALLEQLALRYRGKEDPRTVELVWVDVTVVQGALVQRSTVHGPLGPAQLLVEP